MLVYQRVYPFPASFLWGCPQKAVLKQPLLQHHLCLSLLGLRHLQLLGLAVTGCFPQDPSRVMCQYVSTLDSLVPLLGEVIAIHIQEIPGIVWKPPHTQTTQKVFDP